MIKPASTVHPLDFSQLSGHEFERLVFATIWRSWPWEKLDWYGQVGDDGGRDIYGYRQNDWGEPEYVVIACANWQRLTFGKAQSDMDSLLESASETPDHLIVIGGGSVSANLKTKIQDYARSVSIRQVEVWSGSEFEERLRHYAGTVLRRFFDGEELPDDPLDLKNFVANTSYSIDEALRSLGRLFERPAFTTPFHIESSLPAFRRAISDTIEAINTGLHKNRDGVLIRRLPAKHDFEDPEIKGRLSAIVKGLNELRMRFDQHIQSGKIQECGCSNPNCHTFSLDEGVAEQMNDLRDNVLSLADSIIPDFNVEPKF